MKHLFTLSLAVAMAASSVPLTATAEAIIVNVDNFDRAQTDMEFDGIIKMVGSINTLHHNRTPTPIDKQNVIRMNRDTLYSLGVVDISNGATVTLPDAGNRYMSLMVINNDGYVNEVFYGAGAHELTVDKFDTPVVGLVIRTLANPEDQADLAEAHALQDKIEISAGSDTAFAMPDYDEASYKATLDPVLDLAKGLARYIDTFGSKDEVNPVHFLIGTASAWGGLPDKDAVYVNVEPNLPVGEYELNVKDVPVKGFWSISLYNAQGYFQENDLKAYSLNNLTAKTNSDGSYTIRFGGCGDGVDNCLPIMDGWNYAVRMYEPEQAIQDGSWTFPRTARRTQQLTPRSQIEVDKRKRTMFRITMTSSLVLALSLAATAQAEVSQETIDSLGAPDRMETSIGTLDFRDGAPSAETAQKVFDALDFTNALNVYNNSFRGASALGFHKGFQSIGADYNDVAITSELLDSAGIFLTGNADTVYYLSVIDLSNGPMVIEQPSNGVGTINDMWFSWIIDVGGPGPDRGQGGKYLIVGPGYDGPLPEGGYFVAHSKTNRILYASRAYLVDNDPKPAVENIKTNMKIYPYTAGGFGTSIAQALTGAVRLGEDPAIPETTFVEASNVAFNTVPPSDFGFYEWINENVQAEPATSYDVELAGQLAAIGIVKGQDFAPNERMKGILTDAAAVGQAAGRVLNWRPYSQHPDWAYYDGSMWGNMLWEGGAFFETPPPAFADGEFKPLPPTGARTLDSRTAFYYGYTLDSPGMIMNIPGVGSQYLMGFLDAEGDVFDGAKTYKVTLPKDIPAKAFWSLTVYDNQTRSMLQTPQKYPRAGSQSYPSPAATAAEDGSTTVWFSPEQPDGVDRGNWIQTDPEKGWFTILRLYSPLPSFFDKSWQISEIEVAN